MKEEEKYKKLPLKSRNDFKVPEGYFENLSQEICAKAGIDFKNEDSTMPDNYFKDLPENIMEKIRMEDNAPVRTIRIIPWASIAAAVVLILVGFFLYDPVTDLETGEDHIAYLTYLENNSDHEIIDALFESDLVTDSVVMDVNGWEPSLEELAFYLEENADAIDLIAFENILIEE